MSGLSGQRSCAVRGVSGTDGVRYDGRDIDPVATPRSAATIAQGGDMERDGPRPALCRWVCGGSGKHAVSLPLWSSGWRAKRVKMVSDHRVSVYVKVWPGFNLDG